MKTNNIKNIAIYGAGGYGREIACLINGVNEKTPQWKIIGFFDDGLPVGYKNEYGKVLGGLSALNQYPQELAVVMAIANPQIVKTIIEQTTNPLIDFPNIIAPDVLFLDKTNMPIGQGNIIGARSFISCNVKFGNFNRLNYDVSVGHDTIIGNYNMFNPSVRISGEITIGDCNFFGVSSIVLQQKTIGNNTTVAANSVIIRKTKDNTTYIGNPAVELKY
jgi:sugar O-acyltransferase (sialic acid O-acetyltransferase NeuD family)